MNHTLLERAKVFLQAHKNKSIWHRITTSLAAVVVFVTTYMLILPAITMERPTDTAGVLYPECVRQLKVMLGLPASAESATPLPKTIRLAGMSTSSLSKAAATAVQPSLDDMLEEADNARGQTSQARLHDAEAALDAVRRKFGNKAAQFGA